MEGENLDPEIHDCMPGPYSFVGHVFLRNCQALMEKNPTRPCSDIYWAVRDKIMTQMGVAGTTLTAALQQRKKEIIRALKPYHQLHNTLLKERRKYIPRDLMTMDEFDENSSHNFSADENLCKYSGTCNIPLNRYKTTLSPCHFRFS